MMRIRYGAMIAVLCCAAPFYLHSSVHTFHLRSGWYPSDPRALDRELDNLFEKARDYFPVSVDPNTVRALIAPHAGYGFSGICAASVYASLFKEAKNKKIKRVIVLAPSHSYPLQGIALPDYDAYKTPLGKIKVDKKACTYLGQNKLFFIDGKAHEPEHSLEIQLPFLQKALHGFTLVPLIVGSLDSEDYSDVAGALRPLIDEQTLVVASSDFVHHGRRFGYSPFTDNILYSIRNVDGQAFDAISARSPRAFDVVLNRTGATICGRGPIRILVSLVAQGAFGNVDDYLASYYTSPQIDRYHQDQLRASLLKNVPDKEVSSSVSYMGIVFADKDTSRRDLSDQLTGYEKRALVRFSRDVLENEFASSKIPSHLLYPIKSRGMIMPAGSFVTLNKKSGALRGCIGNITSSNPLYATVEAMTKSAAFHDGRFKPVTKEELSDIALDVSVLGPPREVDSYKKIVLGKHGIILKKNLSHGSVKSAVFLPTVAPAQGWTLQETLENLSVKAGLPKDGWKTYTDFEVFEGIEIHED